MFFFYLNFVVAGQITVIAGCIWALATHKTIYDWAKIHLSAIVDGWLVSDAFFFPMVICLFALSLFVLYLSGTLLKTHWGNYFAGKTTVERFGRSAG
jgi:hypothetical protein